MPRTARVNLTGPLAGHHIVIDLGRAKDTRWGEGDILNNIANILVSSNLPNGIDRTGFSALTVEQIVSLTQDVQRWVQAATKGPRPGFRPYLPGRPNRR